MEFHNTPASVKPGETDTAYAESLKEQYQVVNENIVFDSDATCDTKNNKTIFSEENSTFQNSTEQNKNDQNSLDFSCPVQYSEKNMNSKSPSPILTEHLEMSESESCDNPENSNDSDFKSKLSNEEEPNGNVFKEDLDEKEFESINDANCHDRRRTRRNSKRKREADECCPVCGVTVRLPELESHFIKEVDNLAKIPRNLRKSRAVDNRQGISTTFVQVKSNRENRLSAKVAKYTPRDKNVIRCPVCSLQLKGPQEERNRHVLNCINEDESSDEFVVVDEDSFEEYEFADQTRVRAISFVPGGYRSLQGLSARHKTSENEEELNVNVDVDDTMTFGKPQYTEMDVIHNTTDVTEVKELEQLRKAVLLDPTIQPHVLESRKWINDDGNLDKDSENFKIKTTAAVDSNILVEGKNPDHTDVSRTEHPSHAVSSLKEKIKDLEELNRSVKCLICLESYTKPVVSTTCWHVHCEECWLMTMGVKKLCPQCNMIVFPSDLRRIYL